MEDNNQYIHRSIRYMHDDNKRKRGIQIVPYYRIHPTAERGVEMRPARWLDVLPHLLISAWMLVFPLKYKRLTCVDLLRNLPAFSFERR